MSVNLKKGGRLSLTKERPGLNRVIVEDLVQCLNDVIEDQVIDDATEEESNNGMASKTQIYMAMQVFDSESGEFDMQGVDNQLIFDTDDEDSFEFSCHNDEEKPKEQYNVEDYMFDTSEEE